MQLKKKDPDRAISPVCTRMEDFRGKDEFDAALCVFTVILYLLDEDSLKNSLNAAYGALRSGGMLLLDIPSEAIFRGYSRCAPSFERTVTVTRQKESIYIYREEVNVQGDDYELTHYVDEFPIRHWSSQQVLEALGELGFIYSEDLTCLFFGTGSNYYLYQKLL